MTIISTSNLTYYLINCVGENHDKDGIYSRYLELIIQYKITPNFLVCQLTVNNKYIVMERDVIPSPKRLSNRDALVASYKLTITPGIASLSFLWDFRYKENS